jgi:hypothetical protein
LMVAESGRWRCGCGAGEGSAGSVK